ncbi:MAG: N-acyl homoserine lactonase family protein [Negativicutes bacterium]|nr:N-acyl homoserine lactonase family protein [Negativicutes bacterium]
MSSSPVIRPAAVGVFQDFEVSLMLYQRRQGERGEFPCIIFVIEAEGRKIVVDTGPSGPELAAKYHMPVRRDRGMEPSVALKNLGVDPEEVELVILTHLHWDHSSNCGLFPNATFLVQKSELQFAVAPNPVQNGQYETGIRGHNPPWMEVFSRIQTVEGDVHDVVKGVHLIWLPGHTPGSMGVAVETAKGVHLIAGDFIPLMANWNGDQKLKHIPGSIHINLDDYHRSFVKAEKLADVILPSHDFATLEHGQYPIR